MIFHKSPVNPYHVELWILISDDPENDVSRINVSNPGINVIWPKNAAACTTAEIWKGVLCTVFDKKQLSVDIVAHEAVHILNMIYTYSGVDHDPENDEPQAYLMGWIVGEIYRVSKLKK